MTRFILTLGLAAVLAACGGGTEPQPQPREIGIKVLSGDTGSDTISTVLASQLVVEVRDSTGALAPHNTMVQVVSDNHGGVVQLFNTSSDADQRVRHGRPTGRASLGLPQPAYRSPMSTEPTGTTPSARSAKAPMISAATRSPGPWTVSF